MMISLDRFFVQVLNESGIEVDYKKLVEIYQQSRKLRPIIKEQERLAKLEAFKQKAEAAAEKAKRLKAEKAARTRRKNRRKRRAEKAATQN